MAIEYTLKLGGELTPAQALKVVGDELGVVPNDYGAVAGSALYVYARETSAIGQKLIQEGFGFRPTIYVMFRLQSETDDEDETARHVMMRATMQLLRESAGDAVLLFNGEYVLLQRLKGHLVLNEEWREWKSYSVLPEVTLPYEMRALPSPLL